MEAGPTIRRVSGMAFFALQDRGRQGQVFQPAVGAGADEDLLNFGALQLPGGSGIVHGMRFGDRRFQFIQIDI